MEAHSIVVKQGVLVDASIIDTPLFPKGMATYKIAEGREEAERSAKNQSKETASKEAEKRIHPGIDTAGPWIRKAGRLRYGNKKHHITEEERLAQRIVTTPVNLNEGSPSEEVLDNVDLTEHVSLKSDKGYQSEKNSEILAKRKLKNPILKKAKKAICYRYTTHQG